MKKGKEKKEDSVFHLVKLGSLGDLARNVSFGDAPRPLYAFKEKGAYRLFCNGPKVGDAKLVFYFEVNKIDNCLLYRPDSPGNPETLEFRSSMVLQAQDMSLQNIPIIELLKSPFGKEGKVKAKCIGVKGESAIVKAVISRALEHEGMGKLYCFDYKNGKYVGAFNLLDEDGEGTFCYAKAESKELFGFFRYNYTSDRIEPTNSFGEHSYLYVKVINLDAAFIFFKPE